MAEQILERSARQQDGGRKRTSHSEERSDDTMLRPGVVKGRWNEICKNCKMQITRSTGFVPSLERVCFGEEWGSRKVVPGSLEEKRKQYLENIEAIPEYDFVTDQSLQQDAAASIPLDQFHSVEERIAYMESHNLSLRNLIQQDIKEQNKGMYRKLFISRMLKTMDSDSVFDQII